MGSRFAAFSPATTITSSVADCSTWMAAERNVPPCQGNSALSRPMRDEAPAARITPANDGERGIREYYNYFRLSDAFLLFMWGRGVSDPRRRAIISATMETAISSGVMAPI